MDLAIERNWTFVNYTIKSGGTRCSLSRAEHVPPLHESGPKYNIGRSDVRF
jgi:hypothetical protein